MRLCIHRRIFFISIIISRLTNYELSFFVYLRLTIIYGKPTLSNGIVFEETYS